MVEARVQLEMMMEIAGPSSASKGPPLTIDYGWVPGKLDGRVPVSSPMPH